MSEENTPPEVSPETTETPTPVEPSMNLDSTIKVDGQEISVRDLINSRDENANLKAYNEQARKLIAPNQGGSEDRASAIRFLMTQEGYQPNEIDEYVQWTEQVESGEYVQQPQQQEQYAEEPQYEGEQFDEQQYYQEQIMREQDKARMNEIEARQSRIGTEMMKKEMSNAIDGIMSSNSQLAKLMDVNEGNESRLKVLRQEVETSMMESLRKRRASGENFNNSWFTEEAGKAAGSVYDKFSSVIGDPDKIQRAPETATEDSLFNKPPVTPPKYEKGDDMGSINTKTREYTLDTLLRGAREGAAGGESKA